MKAMKKIEEIARCHQEDLATNVYAWLLYHPAGECVISDTQSPARLDLPVSSLEVKLAYHDWYGIYTASGQQVLR